LRRVGKKKQASFRVVVADARSPRDGRFIETIGHYNPRTDPPTIVIKEDRALHWLSHGAQPTDAVERMLRNMGTFEKLKLVRQGVSIEELVTPPEPEVEEVEAVAEVIAEAEPELAAEEVIAEAEAIVAEAPEAVEEVEAGETPAEEEGVVEEAEAVLPEEVAEEIEEAVEAPEEIEEAAEVPEAAEGPVASGVSLEALGLSTRVLNVLSDAGLETAQDVLDKLAEGDAEFLSIPGAGGATLQEVQERLAEHGFLELVDEEAT
ncbi:MAG: 30S ribosomal protein S16, partial [Anaerolineae bacterium]